MSKTNPTIYWSNPECQAVLSPLVVPTSFFKQLTILYIAKHQYICCNYVSSYINFSIKKQIPKVFRKKYAELLFTDSEIHIFNTMYELSIQVMLYNIKLGTQTQNVHN